MSEDDFKQNILTHFLAKVTGDVKDSGLLLDGLK
jgi:hypothetical protein